MGYESLHALEEAGGLDALYVEPALERRQHIGHRQARLKISGMEVPLNCAGATDARLFHDFMGRPIRRCSGFLEHTHRSRPRSSPAFFRADPCAATVGRGHANDRGARRHPSIPDRRKAS